MKKIKTSPFHKAAMFLYKQACLRKLPLFSSAQVENDLKQMHPGENIQWIKTDYYVKKLSMTLTIVLVGGLFGAAARLSAAESVVLQEDGSISRCSPGSHSCSSVLHCWWTACFWRTRHRSSGYSFGPDS